MHRIEAELLLPGHGAPIRDGVVVLDGSVISYAGPAGVAPATPGAPVTRVTAVMPGMWDCHGHLLGIRTFDLAQLPLEPEALGAARCTRDMRAALDAGITSVRDVGGLGVHLARAVAEGVLDGPAVYGAGAILSTTGGHGDLHSLPLDWMRDFSGRDGLLRLADGPEECARAAREQLRRNCAPSWRSPGWPSGRSPRTATASRASWRPCGPACAPSSTAPISTTSAATRCARPAPSWSRPGRSSRTCWRSVRRCRTTRWPSWTRSPTSTRRR